MARERDYELGIVLAPETPDEQARAIVERITNTVTAQGGVVVRINAWGRRRLAYPIEHHRDGLYYFFDLAASPDLGGRDRAADRRERRHHPPPAEGA